MAEDDAGRSRRQPPKLGRVARPDASDGFDAFARHDPEAPSGAGELSGNAPPSGQPRGSIRRLQWAGSLGRTAASVPEVRPVPTVRSTVDGAGLSGVAARDEDGAPADAGIGSGDRGRRRGRLVGLSVVGLAVLGVGLLVLWFVEPTSAPVRAHNAAQGVPTTPDVARTTTSAPGGLASLVPMAGGAAGGSATAAASSPPPAPSTTTATGAHVQVGTYVAELGSGSATTVQAAISGMAQLMKSSPADQPAAINALCAYLRSASPAGSNDNTMPALAQKAVAALVGRDAAHDGGTVLKLDGTNLTGANLSGADLAGASAQNTDFDTDNLSGANLSGADLRYAYLGETTITNTDFASANLANASFAKTPLCNGKTPTEPALGYNCVL